MTFTSVNNNSVQFGLWINLLIFFYVALGIIASHTNSVETRLIPGTTIELTVLRLASDKLKLELGFNKGSQMRTELGEWAPSYLLNNPKRIKFTNPGSDIRLSASTDVNGPIVYQAMPAGSHNMTNQYRELTTTLSIEPGVWHDERLRQSHINSIPLHAGVNFVRIKIDIVEPPLIGEKAILYILPPLTLTHGDINLAWLWFGFLWPFILPFQLIWLYKRFLKKILVTIQRNSQLKLPYERLIHKIRKFSVE